MRPATWGLASSDVPPLASVEAYLERIGLAGRPDPGLAEIHRAHATTIPFENFDSFSGDPVSLDLGDLEAKIVGRRPRRILLRAQPPPRFGSRVARWQEVSPLLARVRLGPEGAPRPLNHLLLRVRDRDGASWLADVGFGGGGLLDPVPFETEIESDQSGWHYRIVEDGPEMVLQVFQDGDWSDMYGFVPEPAKHVDIVVSNWFTATHPESPFVTGLMAGLRSPGALPVALRQRAGGPDRTTGRWEVSHHRGPARGGAGTARCSASGSRASRSTTATWSSKATDSEPCAVGTAARRTGPGEPRFSWTAGRPQAGR